MSNTVITLLVVFAFAAGLGLGLIVMRPRAPSLEQKLAARQRRDQARGEVYFGRDDNDPDHPHDIERQGALALQRAAEYRYDGMADGDAPYVPSGLDFADRPR